MIGVKRKLNGKNYIFHRDDWKRARVTLKTSLKARGMAQPERRAMEELMTKLLVQNGMDQ